MPPVSIPEEAGCSSAGPSTSTSALPVNPTKAVRSEPAWPEQIQTKISQLEKVRHSVVKMLESVCRSLRRKRSQRKVSGERSWTWWRSC